MELVAQLRRLLATVDHRLLSVEDRLAMLDLIARCMAEPDKD